MKKIILSLMAIVVLNAITIAQLNTTLVGKLTYNVDLADVWGYVDQSGNEYAIVGRNDGISIVSLQNPANPVELFFVPGPNSIWRDMYIYNDVLYTTNETSGGLSIIDLSGLPNSIGNEILYTGFNYPFQTAHNLIGDENGYLYIFGSNYGAGGAIILDISQDPFAPVEVGVFDTYYIHDGNVKGDTLWAACVNDGIHAMVDVSDKTSPVILATFSTPHNFTHNSWYSDNSKYVFTTDEVSGGYITSYDVSDFSNIKELDRFQSNPGSNVIPHNVHYYNGYLVTSYYRDGLVVIDAARPHNLIEVANYDTSPNYSGDGFNGAWGAYPWLPSGLVLVSDIEEGLYIFMVNYQRACYLEGTVTDANCGAPITNATVEIVGENQENVKSDGSFATGTAQAGTYTVIVNAPGYSSFNTTVTLSNGTVTNLDVQLSSTLTINLTGEIETTAGQNPVASAMVEMNNGINFYTYTADASGQFSSCNFVSGDYNITAGKWGYQTYCDSAVSISASNNTITIGLQEGYYDDFSLDLGWTETSTATTGKWERGEPFGTLYSNGELSNPEYDAVGDCGNKAYVTGNMSSQNYWDDDIDNGYTILTSPTMDLSNYSTPYLSFDAWFFNAGGNGTPNDFVRFQISNGTDTVTLKELTSADPMSTWQTFTFALNDYITVSSNMNFIVWAEDVNQGNIVEAAIDNFKVTNGLTGVQEKTENAWKIYPNPAKGYIYFTEQADKVILYNISGQKVLQAFNTSSADITSLSPGVYFVKAQKDEKTYREKLIIY